ncbi:MAG: alpha/beta hydrolase [Butyrivibrio sp.]|nr:alpha/beta hydrolase [Butyrivibrio sp.]
MGKKGNVFFMGVVSTILGGLFIGDRLYKMAAVPKLHEPDEVHENQMIQSGRMWVRNSPDKKDIYLDSIDKLHLHAAYIANKEQSHKYAICIHGINDNSEYMGAYALHYQSKGYNTLLPDLRGHGKSEGGYAGFGIQDRYDILQWIYWIIKRDKDAKIVLHGVSMGAATVLMTTGERLPENVKAAVEDSSYTTVKEQFADVYHMLKGSFFPVALPLWIIRMEIKLRADYDINDGDCIAAVKRSATPTMFMHGDSDRFINPKMCKRLFEASTCEKEYCTIIGADHIEGIRKDTSKYWSRIDSFIDKQVG